MWMSTHQLCRFNFHPQKLQRWNLCVWRIFFSFFLTSDLFKQCKRKSYTHVHPSIPLEGSGGWRSETETCESIQSVQIHQHNPKKHANISKQVQYWRTTGRLPLAVSNDGSVLVLILSVSRSKSHSRHYTGVYNTESDLSPSSSELEPLEFSSITRECLGKEEEEREGGEKKKSERKKRGKKKREKKRPGTYCSSLILSRQSTLHCGCIKAGESSVRSPLLIVW